MYLGILLSLLQSRGELLHALTEGTLLLRHQPEVSFSTAHTTPQLLYQPVRDRKQGREKKREKRECEKEIERGERERDRQTDTGGERYTNSMSKREGDYMVDRWRQTNRENVISSPGLRRKMLYERLRGENVGRFS